MSDTQQLPESAPQNKAGDKDLFSAPPPEPPRRGMILSIAGAVILVGLIAGGLVLRSHHSAGAVAPNTILPSDPYAANLVFTQLAMSQSTSLSGGTSTFIDGHVKNTGSLTVTGATMQVVFRNDMGLSPQVETLPLSLIRTHEPYVDTELLSAAPLKPGDDMEFRLIFETIPANWNQQMPELAAIHIASR